MIVLLVLGVLVLALVLLSLVRVGARARYAAGRLEVWLLAGSVKIPLYPRKPRSKPKKKKARGAGKKRGGGRPKPEADKLTPGQLFELARALLPAAVEAAGRLRRKIRIDTLLLDVAVASADPAKTAVNFGRLNWAVSAAWPLIEQNFKLKDYRVRIRPDFLRQSPEVFLEAAATLTVGQILALGARLLPKLMPILTQKDKSGSKTRQQSQKEAV